MFEISIKYPKEETWRWSEWLDAATPVIPVLIALIGAFFAYRELAVTMQFKRFETAQQHLKLIGSDTRIQDALMMLDYDKLSFDVDGTPAKILHADLCETYLKPENLRHSEIDLFVRTRFDQLIMALDEIRTLSKQGLVKPHLFSPRLRYYASQFIRRTKDYEGTGAEKPTNSYQAFKRYYLWAGYDLEGIIAKLARPETSWRGRLGERLRFWR